MVPLKLPSNKLICYFFIILLFILQVNIIYGLYFTQKQLNIFALKIANKKQRWSQQEIKTFFDNFEKYGTHFKQYEKVLNRTHSQIKSFFHNFLAKQSSRAQLQYKKGSLSKKEIYNMGYSFYHLQDAMVLSHDSSINDSKSSTCSISEEEIAKMIQILSSIKQTVSEYKKGMPYMIEVFGCNCGHCIQQIPHIANLTKKNPNVFIVSVSQDNDQEIQNLMSKRQLMKEFNVAQDKFGYASGLMRQYNQSGVPHCFVFDKNEKLVFQGHPSDCDSIIQQLEKDSNKRKFAFTGKGHIL